MCPRKKNGEAWRKAKDCEAWQEAQVAALRRKEAEEEALYPRELTWVTRRGYPRDGGAPPPPPPLLL